jgi:hypothetical protein
MEIYLEKPSAHEILLDSSSAWGYYTDMSVQYGKP